MNLSMKFYHTEYPIVGSPHVFNPHNSIFIFNEKLKNRGVKKSTQNA